MNKTDNYPSELDPAKELFWRNMMAASGGTTTKTKILAKLEEIQKNTQDVPWLSKLIGNVFKFGGSQAEQKYPSRKK